MTDMSRKRRSFLEIPVTSTRFCDDVAPDWILIEDTGKSRHPAIRVTMALFAFPSNAGAVTRQPMAFRHSL